jgi:aconitate hydratase
MKTAFCGPCCGAGDVPANGGFSIRHSTRNFPNREGSKPGGGQIASVALMDARSIAASAANGGFLTPATDVAIGDYPKKYTFHKSVYEKSVYDCWGKENSDALAVRSEYRGLAAMIALPTICSLASPL